MLTSMTNVVCEWSSIMSTPGRPRCSTPHTWLQNMCVVRLPTSCVKPCTMGKLIRNTFSCACGAANARTTQHVNVVGNPQKQNKQKTKTSMHSRQSLDPDWCRALNDDAHNNTHKRSKLNEPQNTRRVSMAPRTRRTVADVPRTCRTLRRFAERAAILLSIPVTGSQTCNLRAILTSRRWLYRARRRKLLNSCFRPLEN